MTVLIGALIALGTGLSIVGLIVAWRGAREDVERAERDLATAARLREQERREAAALPADKSSEQSRAVHAASAARYEAAGLDRPSYENLPNLPLMVRLRETRRAGRGVRTGVLISAAGVAVSAFTAVLGL